MKSLRKLIIDINYLLSRVVPDAFTIAILLTIVVFFGSVASEIFYLKKSFFSSLINTFLGWGNGFFTLLEFGMQMSLIILSGYILAVSRPVERILVLIIKSPKNGRSLAVVVSAISMLGCFINWGFGLILGAMLVKTAYSLRRDINYVFLVAVAYLGLGTLWHGGLSGSVPLLLATENHFLVSKTGVVPVSETIFSIQNIILMSAVFIIMLVMVYLLYSPSDEDIKVANEVKTEEKKEDKDIGLSQRLENSYLLNLVIFLLILIYNVIEIVEGRFNLSLNKVNMIFLGLGFLLHPSPKAFLRAAQNGASLIIGVVIQFPLYAGIYGMIKGTALLSVISDFFLIISSQKTLSFVIFVYSGILNYFVPSGGSKWAIEAPYIIDVAQRLGVPISKVAMFYAYGDMWTNLIQPFWAIPLLAAAGIEFKRILGYELIFATIYGVIITIASFIY